MINLDLTTMVLVCLIFETPAVLMGCVQLAAHIDAGNEHGQLRFDNFGDRITLNPTTAMSSGIYPFL
jgi:hypothetical protein